MAGKYRDQPREISFKDHLKMTLPEVIFHAIPGAATAAILALGFPAIAITSLAVMTGTSVVYAFSLLGGYGVSVLGLGAVLGTAVAATATTTAGALVIGALAAVGASSVVWSIQRAKPMRNIVAGTAIGAAMTFIALPEQPQSPTPASTVKTETPAASLRHNFNALETVTTAEANTPAQKPVTSQEPALKLL